MTQLSRDGKAKEYPIQFPNKLEIESDISLIYNQLKIKGTMEETTGYNGFTPSDYAEELYRDAKVNSQRKQRLQRRLDNLAKEQQQNLKHQMKQRIFKAGIEYYEARAEYCYYLADSAYETEFKIWTDIILDFMAELEKRKKDIFWDVEYAMFSAGIKYFNTCSEYWLCKVESEYIKAEKEYLSKATDI